MMEPLLSLATRDTRIVWWLAVGSVVPIIAALALIPFQLHKDLVMGVMLALTLIPLGGGAWAALSDAAWRGQLSIFEDSVTLSGPFGRTLRLRRPVVLDAQKMAGF